MLISKDTYCFNCHQKGFPSPKWVEIFEGFTESVIVCPHCKAKKVQCKSGNSFVSVEYFRPDGSLVPYYDKNGNLVKSA